MEVYNWSAELKKLLETDEDELEQLVIQLPSHFSAEGKIAEPRIADIDDPDFRRPFDPDFGIEEGIWFTAWGSKWIYFPVSYDGAEAIKKVPRHPMLIATQHI